MGTPYGATVRSDQVSEGWVRVGGAHASATEAYVAPLRALRLTHPVPRNEPGVAFEHLVGSSVDGVLLAGPAGIGKTDVILSIVNKAKADNWPVLCMRVDRLEASATAESLGEYLELPGSPASP